MTTAADLAINVRVRDFATREMARIKDAVSSVGQGFNRLSTLATPLWRIMFTITTLAAPFVALAGAIYKVAEAGVAFNRTMESAKLGIAALIAANTDITDSLGRELQGREKLVAAQSHSLEIVKYLQQEGLKTVATTEQLVEAFQQAVGPGLQVQMSMMQIAQLTVRIVQAAGALGLPMEQLNEEVRSILSGTINMHSRVAKVLGITNEMVASWKNQGNLFTQLMGKLESFGALGEAAAKSWAGVTSNLKEAWQLFSGKTTEGMFEKIKTGLNEAFSGIFDIENLDISKQFSGIVSAFTKLFDDLGDAARDTIIWFVQQMKDLSTWINLNKQMLGAIWSVWKAIGKAIIEIVGQIFSAVLGMQKWGAESGVMLRSLQAILMIVAGIRDFFALVELGVRVIGKALSEVFMRPLISAIELAAELADFLGKKEFAQGLTDLAAGLAEQIDLNDLAMVNLAEDFAKGNTHVARAIKFNQEVEASLRRQGAQLKKNKEDSKPTTTIKPKPVELTDDQKKKVEDFLTWYKERSARTSGEISAMHGDEIGRYTEEYNRAIAEIAKKERELKDAGIVERKGLSPDALAKIRESYAALGVLREQADQLRIAKTEMYEAQSTVKITEMTLASEEEKHRARVALIKLQWQENAVMLNAALTEEDIKYQAALRRRASEQRKIIDDTNALWVTGSQNTIISLKSDYASDVEAVREQLAAKKITWEQYFNYITARQHRLNEDLLKTQGRAIDGLKIAVRDYVDASSNEYERGKNFFERSVSGMESALGDFLYYAGQGTVKFRDMFQAMGLSILKAASEIIAKMLMMKAVAGIGSLFTPSSSVAGAQGGFGPAGGGPVETAFAAMGGVFSGGFQPAYAMAGGMSMPIRAFKLGGVARRPTIGVVGEGEYDEAVVPMPDGKTIPVSIRGGGNKQTIVVNNEWTINTLDATGFDQMLASKKPMIEGMIHDSLARAGAMREAVRRYR